MVCEPRSGFARPTDHSSQVPLLAPTRSRSSTVAGAQDASISLYGVAERERVFAAVENLQLASEPSVPVEHRPVRPKRTQTRLIG